MSGAWNEIRRNHRMLCGYFGLWSRFVPGESCRRKDHGGRCLMDPFTADEIILRRSFSETRSFDCPDQFRECSATARKIMKGAVAMKRGRCGVASVYRLLLRRRFSHERRSTLDERSVRASAPDAIRFPAGKQSSPMVNVLWGSMNVAAGYLLVCHVGEFHVRRIPDVLVLGAGGLLMALMLSRLFVYLRPPIEGD